MAMQTYVRPFQPTKGNTSYTLAVTAANQSITLPTPIGTKSFRVVVVGSQTIFWTYDVPAVIPTSNTVGANGIAVAAGITETFLLPNDAVTLNFIAAGVGSTVYITIGESA